jgi:hypothetical protein
MITLAEHKNYSFLLFALYGISLSFTGLWYFRLGDRFENLLSLIIWTFLTGIPLGMILCPIVSLIHLIMSKLLGGKGSFHTSLGITSYSLTPIVISLFFVLPIELLTFGIFLFTFNPHPLTIKPMSYIILLCFDTLMAVWTLVSIIVGTKISFQLSIIKSGIIAIVLLIIMMTGLLWSGNIILRYL